MARIAIMALEGMEEEEVEVVEEPTVGTDLDLNVSEIETADAEIDSSVEQVEEAQDIRETVDNVADKVDKSVQSGEGVSDKEAALVEVAVEHFCKRLGYKKKVIPAMEGFSNKETRLEKSKVALENLKQMSTRIGSVINIAQEGIFDSIVKSMEMAFETENKVLAKLEKTSSSYDSKTVKTEPISAPVWGKYLKSTSSKYTASDALKHLNAIGKAGSAEVKSTIEQLSNCLFKLTKEVKGNWFTSNEKDIERIEAIHAEIKEAKGPFAEITGEVSEDIPKEFEPINANDKKKLVDAISAVLKDSSLKDYLKQATSKSNKLGMWALWNTQFRLKGMAGAAVGSAVGNVVETALSGGTENTGGLGKSLSQTGVLIGGLQAEDIKKALNAGKEAMEIINVVRELFSTRVKVCSALVSYIDASVE